MLVSKMQIAASQFYFRFKIWWHYSILVRYLSPRLRYYYFRFRKTDQISQNYDVIWIFQGGGHFRFEWWCHTFKKVENYVFIKFRPDISIHGWDITTSGSCIQALAVLKIYSGFDFNLSPSSACDSASAYRIPSESSHPHSTVVMS